MMPRMRTTVTIDADTEALLKEEVMRTGLSFKEVLNRAIRRALGPPPVSVVVEPIFPAPFPSDLGSFNRLGEEWDDEATLNELHA
jgi:hypothetical protein